MTLLVIPIAYSFFGGARVSKLQRDAGMRRVLEQTEAAKEAQLWEERKRMIEAVFR